MIPPGYKQTEVGVIPEEWDIALLGEIGGVRMCKRVLKHQTREHGEVPFYKIGTFGGVADAFITQSLFDEFSRKYSFPRKGDVLISAAGTIGRTVVYDGVPAYFQDSNIVWIDNDESKVTNEYLWHRYQVTKWSVSHGGTVARLYNDNLRNKIHIPVPPPAEQRAIATALSDVDALLAALDRLIAKKRDLKQAAMQQLLTGQTRLPGFTGKWETKRLGEVLKVRHGKSQHGITAADGRYPILASGGEIGRTNSYLYDRPSVLIGRKGTIDSPQYVDSPFWTVDTLFFTEIANEADAKFIFYKFTMIRWRSYNEASGVPSLNAKTIENIEVSIPPLPEQTAIATVLSDMDLELAALEQRRDKTRALKQGMMQELLTGRTRLV